jgi:hypothetical protein
MATHLEADIEAKVKECSQMIHDYLHQADAFYGLKKFDRAAKHFDVVMRVAASLRGTCDVAVQYNIRSTEMRDLGEKATKLHHQCHEHIIVMRELARQERIHNGHLVIPADCQNN